MAALSSGIFSTVSWAGCMALTFIMTFSVNRQIHMRHHAYISDSERDPDEYTFPVSLGKSGCVFGAIASYIPVSR
jgi:fatty acid desaturase